MMTVHNQTIEPEQKSSIKLIKNAKGDYQWEVKVYIKDEFVSYKAGVPDHTAIDLQTIKRLKLIDSKLRKEYGDKND